MAPKKAAAAAKAEERGSGSGNGMPSGSSLMALQLIDAAKRQKAKLVRRLLNTGAPYDTRDGAGRTALHYAAALQSTEVLRALLAAGAGAHLADADGCGSPHLSPPDSLTRARARDMPSNIQPAPASSSLQPTELSGSSTGLTEVTAPHTRRYTPLHLAAGYGREHHLEILMQHGAPAHALDSFGRSARDIAALVVTGSKVPQPALDKVMQVLEKVPPDPNRDASGDELVAAATAGNVSVVKRLLSGQRPLQRAKGQEALAAAARADHAQVCAAHSALDC